MPSPPMPLAVESAPNPWFSGAYVRDNANAISLALQEHVYLTWTSVLAGLLLAARPPAATGQAAIDGSSASRPVQIRVELCEWKAAPE